MPVVSPKITLLRKLYRYTTLGMVSFCERMGQFKIRKLYRYTTLGMVSFCERMGQFKRGEMLVYEHLSSHFQK
jgi:hypothetical protein